MNYSTKSVVPDSRCFAGAVKLCHYRPRTSQVLGIPKELHFYRQLDVCTLGVSAWLNEVVVPAAPYSQPHELSDPDKSIRIDEYVVAAIEARSEAGSIAVETPFPLDNLDQQIYLARAAAFAPEWASSFDPAKVPPDG